MSDLMQAWNAWLNGPLPLHADLAYVLVSVMRLMLAVAAWFAIRSIVRFGSAAIPGPLTVANVWWWLRLWWFVQVRNDLLLKVGFGGLAVLLVLQIPTGVGGSLNYVSRYLIGSYVLLYCGLLGLAVHFNRRSHGVEHPEEFLE